MHFFLCIPISFSPIAYVAGEWEGGLEGERGQVVRQAAGAEGAVHGRLWEEEVAGLERLGRARHAGYLAVWDK